MTKQVKTKLFASHVDHLKHIGDLKVAILTEVGGMNLKLDALYDIGTDYRYTNSVKTALDTIIEAQNDCTSSLFALALSMRVNLMNRFPNKDLLDARRILDLLKTYRKYGTMGEPKSACVDRADRMIVELIHYQWCMNETYKTTEEDKNG
jgi:hypothetical protein